MPTKEQSIRNVGNKEIYDSYMGILRISPNLEGEDLVDDTTMLFKRLKTSEGNDNKIILSDSDGNQLGLYFVPRVKKTVIINELGQEEVADLINCVVKTDDTGFITTSYHIKTTLFVRSDEQTIRPTQVFSKSKTLVGAIDAVTYPIESPHTDDYFNNKNSLSLINYNDSTPVHEQLNNSLKSKSAQWYVDHIDKRHIVQVNGTDVLTTNNDSEQIPVLYTHDYVLGNYGGHTAKMSEAIKSNFLGNSVAIQTLENDSSVYSKLSYIRLDELVWDRLSKILGGEKRHTRGRYTKLGLGKNYSLTEHLFGVITPNLTDSAPILGTSVSFGGIFYNGVSLKRYLFNCLRQEIKNKQDIADSSGKQLDANLKKLVDDKKITPAKQKEKWFSAQIAKNYILCNGKEITPENFPNANTFNSSLFVVNDRGFAQRNDNGIPVINEQNEVIQAIKNSTQDRKFRAPSLFSFEMSSMRFLRGLNWTTSIGRDEPIDINQDIKNGIFNQNTYNIELVENFNWGAVKKNFYYVGNYRTMYDFKVVNTKHKHYCFSSVTGDPVANGNDPMYKGKTLTNQMLTGVYQSVDQNNEFWKDLFSYSFSKKRSTINKQKQSQTLLYGCQPLRIAGKFAWRIQSDGSITENFEQNVRNGSYFINDKNSTPVSTDKEARKTQLLHMNKVESAAPVSIIGAGGVEEIRHYKSFKCRPRIRWHHESYTVYKNIGGYKLMKSQGGVKRCVTSLPIAQEEVTNQTYNNSTKKKVSFSGKEITMETAIPSPPALSFLPLMKIS